MHREASILVDMRRSAMVESHRGAAGPSPSVSTAGSGRSRGKRLFGRLFRRTGHLEQVEFCDSCGEVCTQECRAEAHRERIRETVLHAVYLPPRH
jgi:hypothetical protein